MSLRSVFDPVSSFFGAAVLAVVLLAAGAVALTLLAGTLKAAPADGSVLASGANPDRTVDTHIKTLRAKLEQVQPQREFIATHRGMGYAMALPTAQGRG